MNKEFNLRLVLRVMGSLTLVEGFVLLGVCLIPIIYGENDVFYFLISAIISFAFSGISFLLGRNPSPSIGKREGSVIVTFTWIIFSLIGMLPFWLSGSIPSFTDAFFETISGFTTTGASILNNIEDLSHGMFYWVFALSLLFTGRMMLFISCCQLLSVLHFRESHSFSGKIHHPVSGSVKER